MVKRAIVLLSGGLDSVLATKLIKEQGIEVIALHFTSVFCNCSRGKKGCESQALRSARELGVEIIVKHKGLDYIKIVENPKFGYGRNMNPCIDCRIYMFKRAKEIMFERNAGFIVTGEVLGQRPMSQRREIMRLIERESGLEGLVLRPLSAKFLPLTIPEREGIIDREKLLNIYGRGRKTQYEFVRKFDIKEFACPAGGCLLTDPNFSNRIRDLFTYKKDYSMSDILLLKIGRHLRIDEKTKFIVGRDEEENRKLEAFSLSNYVLLSPCNFKGPTCLLVGEPSPVNLQIGASILAHYGKYKKREIFISTKVGGQTRDEIFQRLDLDVERFLL